MIEKRLAFAKTTALEVGNLLLDQFYTSSRKGELKADKTLVTAADHDANQFLQDRIKEEFPDDGILSEEGSTIFPENDLVWVLDPLDGTVNFSLGLHHWGVSIALLDQGIPQTAAVYFPIIKELFTACAGLGAELNGEKLKLSQVTDPPFPVFVHCSRTYERYKVDLPYKTRSLGAAAYHLCLVAKGGAVLALESTPKLWDFAGSWLVVKEAGGIIQGANNLHPFPARQGIRYNDQAYSIIAAASEAVLQKAIHGISF